MNMFGVPKYTVNRHYDFYQNRPPARAARWKVCMAWRTGALRVSAGELERRGSTMFVWAS
jgi:hypothetical protein